MDNVNKSRVGDCNVVLLAGGGHLYADLAAKFCRSEKRLVELLDSQYSPELLKLLADSPHKAVLEFDDFIFGIEGCSRVTEAQLIRKRHASYAIKSGRTEKNGKRSFDVVIPEDIEKHSTLFDLPIRSLPDDHTGTTKVLVDSDLLLEMTAQWYTTAVDSGYKEEELRYMKQQGTEWKGLIKMNAAGLKDWFQIRLCCNSQTEIRDLASKMYSCCMDVAPDLFRPMGSSCKVLGYCPEPTQCEKFRGVIPAKKEALALLSKYYLIEQAKKIANGEKENAK